MGPLTDGLTRIAAAPDQAGSADGAAEAPAHLATTTVATARSAPTPSSRGASGRPPHRGTAWQQTVTGRNAWPVPILPRPGAKTSNVVTRYMEWANRRTSWPLRTRIPYEEPIESVKVTSYPPPTLRKCASTPIEA
jgi:hypothetical protein